jgi:hypothetical protein
MGGHRRNANAEEITTRAQVEIIEAYKIFVRNIHPRRTQDAKPMTGNQKINATACDRELRGLPKCNFFLTEKGRLGIISHGLVPGIGDVCCIVFGSSVHFLTPGKNEKHKLVGDCYINGVMNGELM